MLVNGDNRKWKKLSRFYLHVNSEEIDRIYSSKA